MDLDYIFIGEVLYQVNFSGEGGGLCWGKVYAKISVYLSIIHTFLWICFFSSLEVQQ